MKKFVTLTAMSFLLCLVACSDDDNALINLTDKSQKEQKLFADQTSAKVSFTAEEAWTASVKTAGVTRMNLGSGGGASSSSWIKLDKYSGDAGSVIINITLDVNYTGVLRTGTVTIVCGDDSIVITISQDAVDEEGNVPEEPNGGGSNIRVVEVKASDIKGIPSSVNIAEVRLILYDWVKRKSVIEATAKWDGGFTMTLPENIDANYMKPLGEFIDHDDPSALDKNVKMSSMYSKLEAVDASGAFLGVLFIGKPDFSIISNYVYADGSFGLTGEFTVIDLTTYYLDIKKGWNLIYRTGSENEIEEIWTSTMPAGAGWVFSTENYF